MIDALSFVRGVISQRGDIPELTHFCISGGRITGYNGFVTLSSPIALDIEVNPHAATFARAVQRCEGATALRMTPAGRLAIETATLRVYINCVEDFSAALTRTPAECVAQPGLFEALKRAFPFIAEDASRPWAQSALVADGCVTATNNVTVAQIWTGHSLPRICIPRTLIAEMVRIGIEPVGYAADANSITLLYPDDRWIRAALVEDKWPYDKLNALLDYADAPQRVIPEDFFAALHRLEPFIEGKAAPVYFTGDGLATSETPEIGAAAPVADLIVGPIFNLKQLQLLEGVATTIDFTAHPGPCLFMGDNLRGAIIGRTA